jgi:glycosyltransferase involved in cell wall biosynthesis
MDRMTENTATDGGPVVSVVIPAYNASDTIAEALDSVIAQTSAVAIELIVVDDASTDATAEVARAWASDLGQPNFGFRVISLASNTGPAAARNVGIAVARGSWLAFLDADDAWIPLRLEYQLEWLRTHADTAMVSAKVLQEDLPSTHLHKDVALECGCRDLSLEDFVDGNWVATSTVLARRDAVIAAGGFDSRFRGPEDYDLWIRMAVNRRIVCLDCPLAYHHAGMDGLSGDDRTFLPEVLRVLDKVFGPGGALREFRHSKHVAIARQYWHASWMAFNRGARGQAIAYLLRSLAVGYRARNRPWYTWMGLMARYVAGKPDGSKQGERNGTSTGIKGVDE